MMFKYRLKTLIFFQLLIVVFGCKDQNSSIFSSQLSHDRGSLAILNSSNFIGSTVAGTSFEQEIILYSAGGIDLSGLTASITTTDPISFKGGSYPGEGGTCGSELPSGATCTLVILYEPVTTQSHSAVIDISYADALGAGLVSYPIYADSNPILQFEYGTQYDFGNKFIGTTTDLRIKVTNTGRIAATSITINNLTLPFSFKGGSYPGTGGSCSSRLEIGNTCTLVISYAPTNNGQHSQDITFDYINSGRPESSTLSLLAWGFIPADLSVALTPGLDFGTVAAGYAHTSSVTLTYASGDVAATGITVSSLSTPFSQSGGTCGSSLSKATGSCTINFVINTNSSGTWTQNFTITYNSGRELKTITRSITGITKQKAVISFSLSSSLPFGVVRFGQSANQTITMSYVSGELPATGLSIDSTAPPFTFAGGSFPGTGGTCTGSLSSGSCTLVLNFQPSSRNTYSANRSFTYFDGYENKSTPFNLSGATEAYLSWTYGSNVSFGDIVVGQTGSTNINISASAGTPATSVTPSALSAPFSFKGGTYPGTGGNCGATISSSCSVRVDFSPSSIGAQSQAWSISYFDGLQTQTLSGNLSGNGKAAAVLTIADKDFGSYGLNSHTIKYVTVTNSSTMAATNLNLALPSGFRTVSNGISCAAGNTCSLGVVFNPTATTLYSGTMTLSYYDGTTTRTITGTVSGTGILSSDLFLSEIDTHSFGSRYITSVTSKTFTLGHGGSAIPAVINSKTLTLPSDYTITADTCPSSLVSGATCNITVSFSPTSATTRNNTLHVNYDDGAAKATSRLMTGYGLTQTVITFTPSSYNFGAKPTDGSYDYTLQVTRTGPSTTGTPSFTGTGFSYAGGSFPGTGGTCTTAFTSPCDVVIRFTPTMVTSYSGTFKISFNNGFTNTSASIPLTGSGSPTAILSYSGASTSFGTVIQSLVSTRTITLNHNGPVAATGMNATVTSPFRFAGSSYPGTGGTCGSSLSSGSCTMVVEYAPTAVGSHSSSLSMSYTNGTESRTATHTLNGESVAQAILSKSETGSFDFGSTPTGSTLDKTITLFNAGGSTATSLAFSFDSSTFGFKGGTFPGSGGNCSTQLAAGSNCTIVIQFRPQALGNSSGVMTMNYHDGLRTQTDLLDLKGTGT